ncbi:MAG: L,D-transpeptidase, partial [Paracoccaceae bacterium]|nr:L,D-transpeptidase [Paracoccaceae bacterium]
PSWTPTASMRERDPTLPDFMPAGPGNPLGTHAMYLSWPAYLIHGTHDTRKIGRRSSSGCIGLYNEQVEELFALVEIGTQVRLI